jgi:hypothetical protein
MLENLKPADLRIIIAAAVMAVGAFCPIVYLPIVGSLNYVMGGRGDGVYIVGCSAAIIALVIMGYRRTAGLVALGAVFMMMYALVGFSATLSKAQSGLAKDTGHFSGLASLMANSVGLGWGWFLLVGGALGVIVFVMLATTEFVPATDSKRQQSQSDDVELTSAADKKIAEYLENRKISPAIRNQSMPRQAGFGKRV